jgi:hypothetical protein
MCLVGRHPLVPSFGRHHRVLGICVCNTAVLSSLSGRSISILLSGHFSVWPPWSHLVSDPMKDMVLCAPFLLAAIEYHLHYPLKHLKGKVEMHESDRAKESEEMGLEERGKFNDKK